jgi:5-hydroxyisourate hydrolase
MGLSTHVLDTTHGRPAAGMAVKLECFVDGAWQLLKSIALNADGRAPGGPLIATESLKPGRYRLTFEVGAYFRDQGLISVGEAFLESVPVLFGVGDLTQHYHVPLLCSPFGYSTYRGS